MHDMKREQNKEGNKTSVQLIQMSQNVELNSLKLLTAMSSKQFCYGKAPTYISLH